MCQGILLAKGPALCGKTTFGTWLGCSTSLGRSSTERPSTDVPANLPGAVDVVISLLSLLGYSGSFHLRLISHIAFRVYSPRYEHCPPYHSTLKAGSLPTVGLASMNPRTGGRWRCDLLVLR